MSLPQALHPGYTIEDGRSWEGAWERLGGVAYPTYGMTPAPGLEHQRISVRMATALFTQLEDLRRTGGPAAAPRGGTV